MKLLVQPDDGLMPLLRAISRAKDTVELAIFRFDQRELERAFAAAAARGVSVRALIAHTNRAGEDALRRLEMRLLGAGVTVARTGDDFARYHGKLMVIDRRELHLMAFNLTYMDIEHSRSFAVLTQAGNLVREAVKLIEADTARQAYEPGSDRFLVSPANARQQLARFIRGARKQLLIYDPEISDSALIRLLEDRVKAGVEVNILGRVKTKRSILSARKLRHLRLHARAMVRDGQLGFIGSQSLRETELDERREVGLIFREPKVVSRLTQIFRSDWARTEEPAADETTQAPRSSKLAKKVAKAVAKDLPPLAPVLNGAAKDLGAKGPAALDIKEVEESVKEAVKDAVKQAVRNAVEELAGDNEQRTK